MATYTYMNLKSKYDDFHHPVIVLKVNGKDFAKNKAGLVVSDIEVELTSGFEASIASFMIYNTFDTDNSCYRINDIKAYITRAQSMGITDGRALVYFADLENQLGSYGVTRVAKIAIGIAGSADKVTLDILYQAAMQDSVAASSPGRRRTTYEYCLSLNFGDVEVPSDFVVGEYKITAEPSLRVRKGPSTFYDTVGSNLPEGALVEVVEISGGWGKIVRNGVEGWINLLYAEYVGSSSNEQPDIVRYDVNGNGKTDAGDARLTLRASAGIDTLTEAQQKAADADSSGRITAADARLILRASAKMD